MIHNFTLSKLVRFLPVFIKFVYKRFPLAWLVLCLTLISVVFEYATFSLMIPLSGNANSHSSVQVFWENLVSLLGVNGHSLVWIWMFLLLLFARTLLMYVLVWLNGMLSKQVHSYLSDKVFKRVMTDESLEEIYQKSIGYHVSLAGDDTSRAGTIILNFGQFISALLSALAGLLLLYMFSKNVFYVVILFIIFSACLSTALLRRIVAHNSKATVQSRELNTYFIEALNGIRSLRSMAVDKYIVKNYHKMIASYVNTLLKIDVYNQSMKTWPALILLIVGVVWVWPGQSSLPQQQTPLYIFSIATLLIRMLMAMGSVVVSGSKLITDIRAAHDINEHISEEAEITTNNLRVLDNPIGSISLENVVCGYKSNRSILTNVTVSFTSSKVYALVGKSGSGKSTLADTMLGLQPVQDGIITINGLPMVQIQQESLRKKIILVEQETRIFTGSIRDNILLGIEVSDKQLHEAIENAGLKDFITSLTRGIETEVEYQGSNISGGQRQRIGVARAIVRNPDVLILDEATSALDQDTRSKVIHNIRQIMNEGILILITHDHEIASIADEIWNVKNGKVLLDKKPIKDSF